MILGALLGGWFAFWIVPAGVMIGWIVLEFTDLSWLPAQWLSGLLAAGELVLENIVLCIAICTIQGAVLGALYLDRILRPDWSRASSGSEQPQSSD